MAEPKLHCKPISRNGVAGVRLKVHNANSTKHLKKPLDKALMPERPTLNTQFRSLASNFEES